VGETADITVIPHDTIRADVERLESRRGSAMESQIISDFAVPIYLGLPNKRFKVLGRVYDERTSGIGVMNRAFAEGLFSEKDRQRDCADQAKYRGGDAVLVTNDERIIKALGLGKEELSKTTPLFQHKDSAVLVVKFD
jgi:hypothetical protein